MKSLLALTLVSGIAIVIGQSGAAAQESVSIIGISPAEHCAAVAAAAKESGNASNDALETCNRVIYGPRLVPVEMASALLNRGVLHLVRDENELAITDFNAALQANPDLSEAFDNRGIAEAALHRYPAAEADFSRALQLNPEHPEVVYFNRALTYEDDGNVKQAYLDYRKAAEVNPQWDKPAKELARFTVTRPAGS